MLILFFYWNFNKITLLDKQHDKAFENNFENIFLSLNWFILRLVSKVKNMQIVQVKYYFEILMICK